MINLGFMYLGEKAFFSLYFWGSSQLKTEQFFPLSVENEKITPIIKLSIKS